MFFFFNLQGNKDLETELIARKAISLVCEYMENCDAEASYADVCSDFHPTNMSLVAEKIIGMTHNRTQGSTDTTKKDAIYKLIQQNFIDFVNYTLVIFFTLFC